MFALVKVRASHLLFFSGSARGIQNQHQQGECLFEKELACECKVASLRMPMLLLYSRLQFVACYLPQQEGKFQTSCDTRWTVKLSLTSAVITQGCYSNSAALVLVWRVITSHVQLAPSRNNSLQCTAPVPPSSRVCHLNMVLLLRITGNTLEITSKLAVQSINPNTVCACDQRYLLKV